ncbi:MAG: reductive dehalogenase [Candidatus Thorarchaeota archaeon]|nr:MAG: reductive dehalogenase [Candidatus Thorarchaeota archaeon]
MIPLRTKVQKSDLRIEVCKSPSATKCETTGENPMQISESLCNPQICNYECLNACNRIHGEDSPLGFRKDSLFPVINEETCTKCLGCIRACPLNALSLDGSSATTPVLLPPPKQTTSSERPYEVSDTLSRMSEADTIFARVQFDTDYEFYHQTEFTGAEHMISKGILGYSRFEHELSVAAWKLYDSRHSIKRPGIGLDPEADEAGEKAVTDAQELTSMIKKAGLFFGAGLVGIADLDRTWLYTHNRKSESYNVPESYNRAVVMAIEMNYDAIASSPTYTSAAATGLGYSMMAFIEAELVSFIRRMGYNAMTCGNDVGMSVPMAIDAGLGQYGRHGLLITKRYGPRIRIAKVLTDMPLIPDSPDFDFGKAVVRFCETCEKCATTCPSQSIPFGKERTWEGKTKSNNPGIKKWYVNVETCYGFWVANGSECSNCIRSCPYNKKEGFMHQSVMWFVQHTPWLNRLIVKIDDLAGYGKQKSGDKFWKKFR